MQTLTPLAVQTNLESLIKRAQQNPLSVAARRLSDADVADHPSGSNAKFYGPEYATHSHSHSLTHPHGRPSTIREVSYDEGAIFLDDDDDEGDRDRAAAGGDKNDERTGLVSSGSSQPGSRRQSRGRRTSYGTMTSTSEPLKDPSATHHQGRGSVSSHNGKAGNSRSRSKVRSPPRRSGRGDEEDDRRSVRSVRSNRSHRSNQSRGRDLEERPLSPHMAMTKARRESIASWFGADDSSGDEAADVTRGLLGSGGGSMLGAGHSTGLGIGAQGMVAAGMEYDPAEELNCEDLELPVNDQGLEVRVWQDAMKVGLLPLKSWVSR